MDPRDHKQRTPTPNSPSFPPDHSKEAERREQYAAKEARRFIIRRRIYATVGIILGMVLPVGAMLLAGSIATGSVSMWLNTQGFLPVTLTTIGGALSAWILFTMGWGIIRGMMLYSALFIIVIVITKTTIGSLLPAMPGLVSIFVMTGALVAYVTAAEDSE